MCFSVCDILSHPTSGSSRSQARHVFHGTPDIVEQPITFADASEARRQAEAAKKHSLIVFMLFCLGLRGTCVPLYTTQSIQPNHKESRENSIDTGHIGCGNVALTEVARKTPFPVVTATVLAFACSVIACVLSVAPTGIQCLYLRYIECRSRLHTLAMSPPRDSKSEHRVKIWLRDI